MYNQAQHNRARRFLFASPWKFTTTHRAPSHGGYSLLQVTRRSWVASAIYWFESNEHAALTKPKTLPRKSRLQQPAINLCNQLDTIMTCCPYGSIMTFPIVFGIAAYALTLASTFTCHMINVQSADTMEQMRGLGPWSVQGQSALLINGHSFSTGLDLANMTMKGLENTVVGGIENFMTDHGAHLSLGGEDSSASNKCYSWSQFNSDSGKLFDAEMNVSRVFSMASVVLGLILTIKLLFFACSGIQSFGLTAFLCYLEALFVGLSLVIVDSFYCKDADACTFGHSAIMCAVAVIVWALVGVFLSCMPRTLRRAAVADEQDGMKV
jgi:hypothetical protein